MVSGPQNIQYELLALAFETGGEAASAPTVYPIPGGKVTPVGSKESEETYAAGMRDPSFTTLGAEGAKLSIPLPALLDGNGLGELLMLAFGADARTLVGPSLANDHDITCTDTIKTVTVWCYHPSKSVKYRMCINTGWKMELEKGKRLNFTFDLEGAELLDGSEFVLNTAKANMASVTESPKILMASDAYLEYGRPNAAVRENWTKITVTGKTGNTFGVPGKNAPIPAGSSTPQACSPGQRDITVDTEFINSDFLEFLRFNEGGDGIPTATQHRDDAALVKWRLTAFGTAIEAGLNVEADLNNVGSGGVANLAVYSTAQDSNKDLTFTAKVPGQIPTIAYASGTALAVSVVGLAITVTLDDSPAPTADDIKSAIEANAAANALVSVARKTGQNGTGTPSAFTAQPLVLAETEVDCTVGGSYTGSDVAFIEVQIDDATSSPNTLKWRKNGGAWTEDVAITGSAQTLGTTGITVLFSSTTGNTLHDKWIINTHWRRLLRLTLPQNRIKSTEKMDSDNLPMAKSQIRFVAGAGDDLAAIKLRNLRATAYA